VNRFRKRRHALLVALICLYGMVFTYIVFGVDRDRSSSAMGSVDAYAKNITCSRNWFVLGATWSCRADVEYERKTYGYSSFASALTPADIGQPVPMTKVRSNSGRKDPNARPFFHPARLRPEVKGLLALSWLVLGSTALFTVMFLPVWNRSASRRP
jgi:hypothetical protein